MRAILRDHQQQTWFEYVDWVATVTVMPGDDLHAQLRDLEAWVNTRQGWTVGWIAYEAAPCFDAKLPVRKPSGPLAQFGLFLDRRAVAPDFSGAAQYVWQLENSRQHYLHHVEAIQTGIARGDFYQVNFTERAAARAVEAQRLFLQTCRGASYGAYIETHDRGVVCASPELFFSREQDLLTCRPMKGTAPRGESEAIDLQYRRELAASAKDRAENLMIVDMVRNDLSRVARPGTVRTPELFEIEAHPHVWQMTSTVQARTDCDLADAFAALFPAASITGAPKRASMAYIAEHETQARGIYTGTVGFVGPSRCQFNVAIRSAVVEGSVGSAQFGVGAGIVADSSPAREYDELLHKSAVVLPQRAFKLLETLRVETRRALRLDEHLDRLASAAAHFGFGLDRLAVRAQVNDYCAALANAGDCRLRLLLDKLGGVELQDFVIPQTTEPQRLRPIALPIDSHSPYVCFKTTRREHYDQAAQAAGEAEALLYNARGYVTETTIANVVYVIDGQYFTPPLQDGLLDGVLRRELLAQGRLHERSLHLDDVAEVSAWYLINALRGWREAFLEGEPVQIRTVPSV
ncbi:MAG: bifunctional anthranilate synthase component I family protein/class IV aminotransferase [Pseudomonadota bacterium]